MGKSLKKKRYSCFIFYEKVKIKGDIIIVKAQLHGMRHIFNKPYSKTRGQVLYV